MWIELAAGAYLGLRYVYHRLTEEEVKVNPDKEIRIPKIDEGSAIPMFFGRCRIREPVLAWAGNANVAKHGTEDAYDNGPERFQYGMEMFFVVGIPFQDGFVTFHSMWASDRKLHKSNAGGLNKELNELGWAEDIYGSFDYCALSTATYDSPGINDDRTDNTDLWIDGQIELFNGNTFQRLVEDTFPHTARTRAGERMLADGVSGASIPGYRGYACIFMTTPPGLPGVTGWHFGFTSSVQPYSLEVSSFPNGGGKLGPNLTIGGTDANPIDVIYAILVTHWGRLGLDYSQWVDLGSFISAATTLAAESHGYSRAFEETTDAGEMIEEILRQIDATLFEDMETGKFKIKLIRADYNISSIAHVTMDNCIRIDNLACAGWDGAIDKVRVVYDSRQLDYRDDSVVAMRSAEVGNNSGREVVLRYPGCKTSSLAKQLAARELGARSRPLTKCTVFVDRSFGSINPGDVLKITYPEYGFDGRVFRVASVDRGSLEDNTLKLDLIEDFYFMWGGSFQNPWDPGNVDDLPVFEINFEAFGP